MAIALATAPVVLSASDNGLESKNGKVAQSAQVQKAPPAKFATLKDVKATPMSSSELKAVKGLHAHFWNPGHPFDVDGPLPGPPQVVNRNNTDIWLDLGNGEIVGPGYHGLCKAHVKSPAIFINPGGGC